MLLNIKDISYIHPDREPLFNHISLSVDRGQKVSLIGDNGTGKSTLLKIIAGELHPASGEITRPDRFCYVPQHFGQYDALDIAGAIGIREKLEALEAILGGDLSETNYRRLADDWDIEQRAKEALSAWGLDKFGLTYPVGRLSGGEKTRVFLAGATFHVPDLILLDEPTNHLDKAAREKLYEFIRESRSAIMTVSHDRTLLNLLNTTYELSKDGAAVFGGNYEFYKEQREGMLKALREEVDEKEKALRQARKTARETAERKNRKDVRGKKKMKRGGIPRIMLKTITDGAAASAKRMKETHADKINDVTEELQHSRGKLPPERGLRIKLSGSGLHAGKTLVEAREINYSFDGKRPLWPEPLSFRIASGERIAVSGDNGSGKTTLLKLLMGQRKPTAGTLGRADFRVLYIDQEYSLLNGKLTVFEQAQRFNARHLPENELKAELHRFLFPVEVWDKPCYRLSGGERMRLIFCCLLIGDTAPDLFILDEPTNNLDIASLETVTASLEKFDGTLVVVSHDRYFIEGMGISQEIVLQK